MSFEHAIQNLADAIADHAAAIREGHALQASSLELKLRAGTLAAKPEAAKPEAAKPEAAKPEAAKPEAAKPEAAKPEAAKPAPADTPPKVTFADLRGPAVELSQRDYAALEAICQREGVAKISGLPEEKYPEVLAEINSLLSKSRE